MSYNTTPLLNSFIDVGTHPWSMTRTEGIVIVPGTARWQDDRSLTLTHSNFQQLVNVVQSLVDSSIRAREDIANLTSTISVLQSENAKLKAECDELRIACTAVTETEILRLKENFGRCILDPTGALISLDAKNGDLQ